MDPPAAGASPSGGSSATSTQQSQSQRGPRGQLRTQVLRELRGSLQRTCLSLLANMDRIFIDDRSDKWVRT